MLLCIIHAKNVCFLPIFTDKKKPKFFEEQKECQQQNHEFMKRYESKIFNSCNRNENEEGSIKGEKKNIYTAFLVCSYENAYTINRSSTNFYVISISETIFYRVLVRESCRNLRFCAIHEVSKRLQMNEIVFDMSERNRPLIMWCMVN